MLQAVTDEAGPSLLHMRGRLANIGVQLHREGDRVGAGPWRLDHFHQRYEERRIPPVRPERALAMFETAHDVGDRDDRRVAGEDRVGTDKLLDFGEDLLLVGEILEHSLDDLIGAPKGSAP